MSSCAADPRIQSQRLREMAGELGYQGGKSIFDDFVREVRPRFLAPRTFQRTIYRPGELVQCDLWEPSEQIPVGHGQRRRGWVVTCEVCWSRAIAGTLMFSKEAPDILWGLARNLERLGALPEKLVWDREAAIAAGGRPTEPFAAFCGQLEVGWVILEARDPQAKGQLERSHRFMRSNFEPGRVFANHLDFQDRLDALDREGERAGPPDDPGGPGRAARGGESEDAAAARPDAGPRPPPGDPGAGAAVRPGRSQRLLDRPARSPAVASRSASPRPRSPRSCWTPASSRPAPARVRRRADDHRSGASDPAGAPARAAPPAPRGRGRDPAAVAL